MVTYAISKIRPCGGASRRRLDPANPLSNLSSDDKNLAAAYSQDFGKHLRLGAFGYLGKEGESSITNSLWMAGADATLNAGPLNFNLQYLERRDDSPDPETKSCAASAEVVFTPGGGQSLVPGGAIQLGQLRPAFTRLYILE